MRVLDPERFAAVVRDAPLVSIDLIVRDVAGAVLLGWRENEPARHTWFVPGGSIRKDESLDDAFRRICAAELGARAARGLERREATFRGVWEHRYPTNFRGDDAFGTHYVVLAHEVRLDRRLPTEDVAGDGQHGRWRWFAAGELLADPDVHEHVKAYFR